MPLSALTVPLGSSPVHESRNGGSLARVSARAVTGSMRNAGSDEKEDWLETESVSAPGDGGTPTLGKSRLTIRGNSLRLSVLRRRSHRSPSAEFSMGKLCAEFTAGNFHRCFLAAGSVNDARQRGNDVGLKQTYQFRFGARF